MGNNVFISYSNNDADIAKKLKAQLTKQGISICPDEYSFKPDKPWENQIKEAIKSASVMLVLVSKNYNESSWMWFERGVAYGLRKKIVPVLIEDSVAVPSDLKGVLYFNAQKASDTEISTNIKKIIETDKNYGNNI